MFPPRVSGQAGDGGRGDMASEAKLQKAVQLAPCSLDPKPVTALLPPCCQEAQSSPCGEIVTNPGSWPP